MKISCQTCEAKYTIADEKVSGKIVKIKCKKCGSTIVVNGSDSSSGPASHAAAPGEVAEEEGATRVFGAEGGGSAGNPDDWTVNVGDDDQRTMSTAQIADEHRAGVITGDTYVWKDGMGDWLPLSDVPELMAALAPPAAAPASFPAPAPRPAASAQPASLGFGATVMMTEGNPNVPPAAASSAGAAARRAGGRGGVDLFGAKSAPPPSNAPGADKSVGERNENSVLFSLSALTAAENAVKASSKGDDAVIDLRPTGSSARSNGGGRAGFDDIMNLGGGGLGGSPVLAPPPLLAPVVEPPPPPQPQPQPMSVAPASAPAYGHYPMNNMAPQKRSPAGLIIGALVGLVLIGGAGIFFATRKDPAPAPTAGTEQTSQAVGTPPPTVATPEPTTAPTAAVASAEPTPTGEPSAAPGEGPAAKPATASGTPAAGTRPDKPTPEKTAVAAATPPPKEEKPPEAAAPAGEGGREFNRGAATSALGAAAGGARGCKKADGPTGSGKVRVTFAPSGNVTSSQVQGPPFAGTSVGGCVAAAFKSARVPPFDGSPVSVTKSFSIN